MRSSPRARARISCANGSPAPCRCRPAAPPPPPTPPPPTPPPPTPPPTRPTAASACWAAVVMDRRAASTEVGAEAVNVYRISPNESHHPCFDAHCRALSDVLERAEPPAHDVSGVVHFRHASHDEVGPHRITRPQHFRPG